MPAEDFEERMGGTLQAHFHEFIQSILVDKK